MSTGGPGVVNTVVGVSAGVTTGAGCVVAGTGRVVRGRTAVAIVGLADGANCPGAGVVVSAVVDIGDEVVELAIVELDIPARSPAGVVGGAPAVARAAPPPIAPRPTAAIAAYAETRFLFTSIFIADVSCVLRVS
ncbi:MAG TPA: hypothetical protein VGP03_06245 [Pseudonocardiaceae bacterium]|jgi:hypothetical protein|nr:hypothetical protein [Pseudonocardiaceae bacterium]